MEGMNQMVHLHWDFVAFDSYEGDLDGASKMHWAISVRVDGYESEEEAERAARQIVNRKYFKLNRVSECQTCGIQTRMVQAIEDASR